MQGYYRFPTIFNNQIAFISEDDIWTTSLENNNAIKLTSNIALLIDTQVAQKEVTSQKILETLISFQKYDESLNINDFKMFVSIISDVITKE